MVTAGADVRVPPRLFHAVHLPSAGLVVYHSALSAPRMNRYRAPLPASTSAGESCVSPPSDVHVDALLPRSRVQSASSAPRTTATSAPEAFPATAGELRTIPPSGVHDDHGDDGPAESLRQSWLSR